MKRYVRFIVRALVVAVGLLYVLGIVIFVGGSGWVTDAPFLLLVVILCPFAILLVGGFALTERSSPR